MCWYTFRSPYLKGWCLLEFAALFRRTQPADRKDLAQARLQPSMAYAVRNLLTFDDSGAGHHPLRGRVGLTLRGWRAIAIPHGYIPSLLGTPEDALNHRLHAICMLVPFEEPSDVLGMCSIIMEPNPARTCLLAFTALLNNASACARPAL